MAFLSYLFLRKKIITKMSQGASVFFELMATMAISQRSHGRINFAYQSLLYLLKILRNYPRIIQTNR